MITKKIIAYITIVILFDYGTCMDARTLLFDFLIGSQSASKARKIRENSSFIQKWTMGYLDAYITRDLKAFHIYSMLYKIVYWSIIPCFFALLSVLIFCPESAALLITAVYIFIMLSIDAVFYYPRWPHRISKYQHRKKPTSKKSRRR